MRGRFAPSPTGPLHLGNLRTAVIAWLAARSVGGDFVVRIEDLDPMTARPEHERAQLEDLAALGLDWDGPVVRQSERAAAHGDAVATLERAGLLYPCYCTRREIREAASAPNGTVTDGAYPGTCRRLSDAQRRRREADGRRPALRLRAPVDRVTVADVVAGHYEGPVDDVVVRRNDGVVAYNLAVVVDDAAQGVTEVVRGDDLLASTPRQIVLQQLLGLPTPTYAHVPLVVGPDGARLAKRHGAVSLRDLRTHGVTTQQVVQWIASSLGSPLDERTQDPLGELLARFDLAALPAGPVRVDVSASLRDRR